MGPDRRSVPDRRSRSASATTSVLTERPATKTVLPVWVTAIVAVASIAVAVGTVITIYRIGDSGAHAVWNGVVKKGYASAAADAEREESRAARLQCGPPARRFEDRDRARRKAAAQLPPRGRVARPARREPRRARRTTGCARRARGCGSSSGVSWTSREQRVDLVVVDPVLDDRLDRLARQCPTTSDGPAAPATRAPGRPGCPDRQGTHRSRARRGAPRGASGRSRSFGPSAGLRVPDQDEASVGHVVSLAGRDRGYVPDSAMTSGLPDPAIVVLVGASGCREVDLGAAARIARRRSSRPTTCAA